MARNKSESPDPATAGRPARDLRKPRYAAFLLVALLVLACALAAARTVLRPAPYAGMEMLSDGHLHEVHPGSPAWRAGLREGDRVLEADGRRFYGRASLFAGRRIGERLPLTVRRAGRLEEITLPLERVSRAQRVFSAKMLAVGLVFWIVGLLVWMLRPAYRVTGVFFLVSQILAGRLFLEVLDPGVTWAIFGTDVLKILTPAAALHFYAIFPNPLSARLRAGLVGTGYGAAWVVALLVLSSPLWVKDAAGSEALWTALRTLEIVLLAAALGVLLRPHGGAPLSLRRRRRVLIAGMLLGLSPILLVSLVPSLLTGRPPMYYEWTVLFTPLLPLVYAYAVYKGELGKVDLLLNRTLVYLLLTGVVLGLYALLFLGLDLVLGTGLEWPHLAAGAALVVAASTLFVPLRARLQRWVDRLFYGGWYDYRTFVQSLSADLNQANDLDHLLAQLRAAAQTMRFRAGALLWPQGAAFLPRGHYGFEPATLELLQLPADGAVARFLRAAGRPCPRDLLRHQLAAAGLTPGERRLLDEADVQLLAPLVCRGVLRSVLVASQHQGDEILDPEDLAILTTLSNQAAIACENVALLESLRTRLAEVERVRDELAETQRRLAEGREAERLHLARELHDGPVQDLYALNHGLETLAGGMADPATERRLQTLRDTLRQVAATLRDVCIELRPPLLADFGLEVALRSHVARFQEKHPEIDVDLDVVTGADDLPERVQLALFRVCQEALNNAAQHGRARRAGVRLEADAEQIVLHVDDDGRGFTVPERWIELGRRGHLGLLGIAERAEALGGELSVVSAPGRGTVLRLVARRPDENPADDTPAEGVARPAAEPRP